MSEGGAPIKRAYGVHLLTASGAVFAMLAMIAAVAGDWAVMYLWLVAALVVDGIDGPLARRYDVGRNASNIDGVLLDLIIDYLTYVFIPAYALFASGYLPMGLDWAVLVGIVFFSALYFAGDWMKTPDKSFLGFPGCWNMVVLVVFAVSPPVWITVLVIVVLSVAMFLSVRFVHPVRTKRWRWVTLPMAMLWVICAAASAWVNFAAWPLVETGLVVSSLYLLGAGPVQQVMER
ncbi:CDP-alcohol phosphatidyltransferase family protein [Pseudooceanicola sp. MF1-13]|uniref:CDP-alcohol phosphatidyltransferase family protein n=1 Tax=Pseudooceanicola sp. MF1-13 TaxID=3379095 RepID=UPI0038919476